MDGGNKWSGPVKLVLVVDDEEDARPLFELRFRKQIANPPRGNHGPEDATYRGLSP
jgi:hypothetical protein